MDLFRYKIDLLINLNRSNVDYSIKNHQIISKIVDFGHRLQYKLSFSIKFDKFLIKLNFFDIKSKFGLKFESEFESKSSRR